MDRKNANTDSARALENNGFIPLPGPRFAMRGNDYRPGPRQLVINNQCLQAPRTAASASTNVSYVTSFLHTTALWFLIVSPALNGREWGWLGLMAYVLIAVLALLMLAGTSLGLAVPSPRFNRQTQRVYFKYYKHFLALPWSHVRPYVKPKKTQASKSNQMDLYFIWTDWRSFVQEDAAADACEMATRCFGIPPHVVNPWSTPGISLAAQVRLFDYIRRFMADELGELSTIERSSSATSNTKGGWSIGKGIMFVIKSVVYLGAIGPLLQLIFRWSERKARWPDWVERECLTDAIPTVHKADAPTPCHDIMYRCVESPTRPAQIVFVDAKDVRFGLTRARLWLVTTVVRHIDQRTAHPSEGASSIGDPRRPDTSPTHSTSKSPRPNRDGKSNAYAEQTVTASSGPPRSHGDAAKEGQSDLDNATQPPKRTSYFDNLDERYGGSKR